MIRVKTVLMFDRKLLYTQYVFAMFYQRMGYNEEITPRKNNTIV